MKTYLVSVDSSICRDSQVKIFTSEEMTEDYGKMYCDFYNDDNFRDLQNDIIIEDSIVANSKEKAIKIVSDFQNIPEFFLTAYQIIEEDD